MRNTQLWTGRAVALTAGVIGAWYGFGFGAQISGALFGVLMAANGAAACTILASGVWDWVQRRLATQAGRDPD